MVEANVAKIQMVKLFQYLDVIFCPQEQSDERTGKWQIKILIHLPTPAVVAYNGKGLILKEGATLFVEPAASFFCLLLFVSKPKSPKHFRNGRMKKMHRRSEPYWIRTSDPYPVKVVL